MYEMVFVLGKILNCNSINLIKPAPGYKIGSDSDIDQTETFFKNIFIRSRFYFPGNCEQNSKKGLSWLSDNTSSRGQKAGRGRKGGGGNLGEVKSPVSCSDWEIFERRGKTFFSFCLKIRFSSLTKKLIKTINFNRRFKTFQQTFMFDSLSMKPF